MEYKIENGVPLPPPSGRTPSPFRSVLERLEVGQSVWAGPFDDKEGAARRRTVSQASTSGKKKFTTRSIAGGIRVWRIA